MYGLPADAKPLRRLRCACCFPIMAARGAEPAMTEGRRSPRPRPRRTRGRGAGQALDRRSRRHRSPAATCGSACPTSRSSSATTGAASRASRSTSRRSSRSTCARRSARRRGTLTVALAPLPRDAMLDALIDGRVDLLTANLTVTPARAARVDFADPILTGVSEIVVTGPAAPEIATPRRPRADRRSTCAPRAATSSISRRSTPRAPPRARPPIPVVAADENLEDYDLLELVDVGVIPAVVVDSHKADVYAQVFEHLRSHADLDDQPGRRHRLGDAQGLAAADGRGQRLREGARKGTELGNILYRRWIADADRVRNAIAPGEDAKFEETIGFIRDLRRDLRLRPDPDRRAGLPGVRGSTSPSAARSARSASCR